MTPLPPPDVQAAEAHERFRRWWQQEGMGILLERITNPEDREWVELMSRAAYLQGQIDGAGRTLRLYGQALAETIGADGCAFCGAPLPPSAVSEDPVVRELGQLCGRCLVDQAEARDLLE